MPNVLLGQWAPDAADFGNPGAVNIKNAVPGTTSYLPFPSYQVLTDALTARARGAIDVRDKELNAFQYAGDASDIYQLTDTSWGTVSLITVTAAAIVDGGTGYTVGDTLTVQGGTGTAATLTVDSVNSGVIDGISVATEGAYSTAPSNPVSVTGGTGNDDATFNLTTATYSMGDEEVWEFVRWKNQVLATNFDDEPQKIELGGNGFTNLTTDFRCRRLAVVRDFVVAGNTSDSTDGLVPDRIRWSAFDDETDWTVSPTTGADVRDLKGGPIQKIFGGQYGTIFTKSSTFRMDFVGAPVWFQISETLPGVGLIAPGAASRIGDVVYAWSNQGFLAISQATGFTPIGSGKVDEFALADLDDDYLDRISSVADPRTGQIFWLYPGSGNSGGLPNKIIMYDKGLNQWAQIEQEGELLWAAGGVGFTLEQLDNVSASIDDLSVSLDSSQWKGGGTILMGMFNKDNKHGFFDGDAMEAELETKEAEFHPGKRTRLNAFRPLVDQGTVTGKVGTRNRLTDTVTFTDSLTQSDSGRFTARTNARYHRFKLNVTGDWQHALGVTVDREDARQGERRG